MSSAPLSLFVSALFLAWAPGLEAQAVLRVNVNGTGDFSDLLAAVAAASPGDTLLIGPGTYNGPVIDKPLRLVADGLGVELNSGMLIRNIAFPDQVLLNGIEAAPADLSTGSLTIQNCTGTVWVDSFQLDTFLAPGAFIIENSSNVVLVDCLGAAFGGIGLDVTNSTVHVQGGEFLGSRATSLADGSPALLASNSDIDLLDVSLIGGNGVGMLGVATNGGAGLELLNNSTLTARSLSAQGGAGGFDIFSGATGLPGPRSAVEPGSTFTELAGPVHELEVAPVARPGDPVNYAVSGPSGHLVALNLSLGPVPLFSPLAQGSLLITAPDLAVLLGTIDASGSLTVLTNAPPLGPTVQGLQLYAQILALDPVQPAVFTGFGRPISLLGAGF